MLSTAFQKKKILYTLQTWCNFHFSSYFRIIQNNSSWKSSPIPSHPAVWSKQTVNHSSSVALHAPKQNDVNLTPFPPKKKLYRPFLPASSLFFQTHLTPLLHHHRPRIVRTRLFRLSSFWQYPGIFPPLPTGIARSFGIRWWQRTGRTPPHQTGMQPWGDLCEGALAR